MQRACTALCCYPWPVCVYHIVLVCTLSLLTQHAKRMHRIMLLSVACLCLPYSSGLYSFLTYPACKAHSPHYIVICGLTVSTIFSTLFKKGMILGKKLVNIRYVFLFSLRILSENFLILRRIKRDIVINMYKCA